MGELVSRFTSEVEHNKVLEKVVLRTNIPMPSGATFTFQMHPEVNHGTLTIAPNGWSDDPSVVHTIPIRFPDPLRPTPPAPPEPEVRINGRRYIPTFTDEEAEDDYDEEDAWAS